MYKLSRRLAAASAALAKHMLPFHGGGKQCGPLCAATSVYFDLKEDLTGGQTMTGEYPNTQEDFLGWRPFNKCVSIIPEIREGTCLGVSVGGKKSPFTATPIKEETLISWTVALCKYFDRLGLSLFFNWCKSFTGPLGDVKIRANSDKWMGPQESLWI